MTDQAIQRVKDVLDLAKSAVVIVGILAGAAVAYQTQRTGIDANREYIGRVEADLDKYKTDVNAKLERMSRDVAEVKVGVAVLVERTERMQR